jgi:hypothetical protein
MKIIPQTKKLIKELKQVTNKKQIESFYYHLGADKNFYIFTLDQHSITNIDHFINKNLIFIK